MQCSLARALSLVVLALCTAACGDEARLASTQVTARIYIAQDVRAQLSQLRVRSYGSAGSRFSLRAERTFDAAQLDAVVDITFVPKNRGEQGSVLVVADALSQDEEVLVEARATFVFVAHEQRFFELWLYRCGAMPLGTLCSDEACADDSCLTCVRDRCAATPLFAKPQLSALDAAVVAEPDKAPPGSRAATQVDSGATRDDEAAADLCANGEAPPCDSPVDGGDGEDAGAALFDAGAMDAAMLDASVNDASDPGPRDAAAEASTDAQEPPGRCAQASAWTSCRANATIPARARTLGQHTNATGTLPQYLCRGLAPDNTTLVPGKVSGSATTPTRFEAGCYATYRPGSTWQSFAIGSGSEEFQVLTPPDECELDWVAMSAGQALPVRALAIGSTGLATPRAIYACRINVQDAMSSGTHIGRVGNALGDTCHVQYYQQAPIERSQFEILVQTRP